MTLRPTPLHSRFGRRLLILFVGCALLPIGVLALVSYRHVKRQLLHQSELRLLQANRALGLAIFERLLLLDATLRSIPPRAIVQLADPAPRRRPATAPAAPKPQPGNRTQGHRVDGRMALGGILLEQPRTPARRRPGEQRDAEVSRTLIAGLDLLARRRFLALEFVGDEGTRVPVFGRLEQGPRPGPGEDSLLHSGRPLLLVQHGPPARIFLLRRLDRAGAVRGTLVGEVSPEFLWGTVDQNMPSATTRLHVADDSGRALFGSPTPAPDQTSTPADVTVAWPLVLDEAFAAPGWILQLSEPRDEVLGPMGEFTRLFLPVVGGAVLLVLLLSIRQIRRSLVPLEELQRGTASIARRDFSQRVAVTSRDELEELAASFNAMADRLRRQFHALQTAAEIDRTVLAATDTLVIADTVLGRVRDIVPCRAVSVTLVAHEGGKSPASLVHEYARPEPRRSVRVELAASDVQALLSGPDLLRVERSLAPGYLAPLVEGGAGWFVVLPLRYQGQLSGVLALAEQEGSEPDEDDRLQLQRLAAQVAVALANARMLEQVRLLAYYDSLTGLPNRLSHKERLMGALDHAGRTGRLVAAFFIDLDHFSRINDTLGHEAGDQLLQQVAARLRSCCREREDELGPAAVAVPEVARLGGDEFTIIMPGLAEAGDAAKLARRILSALAHPVRLGEREVFVSASIGIAIYPLDGEDIDTLLMHADTAMYKAKEQGGSSYQTYSRSMNATALQRLTLEHDLRKALEREEFELHYQPVVSAKGGTVVGAEALIRWRHPELGLLLPSEFIPLAEENGLILPMGEWVLRTACAQNLAWQRAGLPAIRVDVNLSSRQLRRALAETVGRILETTGLESRCLGLELTESMLVHHEKEAVNVLHTLRAMGLQLSVDDFGTGYSSFSYLKHFPLDRLKIDRSFVRGIAHDRDDAAITTAIIAMGHALGLGVIAEGVETEAHLTLLRQQGCDEMQGYYFGRPVPPGQFAELLRQSTQKRTMDGGRQPENGRRRPVGIRQ